MSVNYLNILLYKFMVLIIPMSPGIIRRCLIFFISRYTASTIVASANMWGVTRKRTQPYRIKTV